MKKPIRNTYFKFVSHTESLQIFPNSFEGWESLLSKALQTEYPWRLKTAKVIVVGTVQRRIDRAKLPNLSFRSSDSEAMTRD